MKDRRKRRKKRKKKNVFWSGHLRPGDKVKYREFEGIVEDTDLSYMRNYQGCVPVVFFGSLTWIPIPLDDLEIVKKTKK